MNAVPEGQPALRVPSLQPKHLQPPEGGERPALAAVPRSPLAIPQPSRTADLLFKILIIATAVSLFAIVGLIFGELVTRSGESLRLFGFRFFTRSVWDPVANDFGALPFIYGTLVSSFLALLLA